MALKHRNKKFIGSLRKLSERHYLICKECHIEEVCVSGDTGAVTCAYCVQRMVAPPPEAPRKNPEEKFPRGWHFKKRYVHTDGKVYIKGVLTEEVDTPPKPKAKVKSKKKKKNV